MVFRNFKNCHHQFRKSKPLDSATATLQKKIYNKINANMQSRLKMSEQMNKRPASLGVYSARDENGDSSTKSIRN